MLWETATVKGGGKVATHIYRLSAREADRQAGSYTTAGLAERLISKQADMQKDR